MNQRKFKKQVLKKFYEYFEANKAGPLLKFEGRIFNTLNDFDPDGNLYIKNGTLYIQFNVANEGIIKSNQNDRISVKLNPLECIRIKKRLKSAFLSDYLNDFYKSIEGCEDIKDDLDHLHEDAKIRSQYSDVMEAYKEYKTLLNLYRDK